MNIKERTKIPIRKENDNVRCHGQWKRIRSRRQGGACASETGPKEENWGEIEVKGGNLSKHEEHSPEFWRKLLVSIDAKSMM